MTQRLANSLEEGWGGIPWEAANPVATIGTITGLDQLVNLMSGGGSGAPENLWWWKRPWDESGVKIGSHQINTMESLWTWEGFATSGAVPGTSVVAPDSSTVGALPFTNATGDRKKFLVQSSAFRPGQEAGGFYFVYDRLLHIKLDSTSLSAQTVGGTITRHTDGVGNILFMETLEELGSTSRVVTVDYTNQAGTASRSTTTNLAGNIPTYPWNRKRSFIPIGLQAGDTGVQSVQDVTLSASAGAGDFVIGIAHPYVFDWATPNISNQAGGGNFSSGAGGVISVIEDNACIALGFKAEGNSAAYITGVLSTVEA